MTTLSNCKRLKTASMFGWALMAVLSGHACAGTKTNQILPSSPIPVIQGFDHALLRAMHNKQPGGFLTRYGILSPVIKKSFASGRIAQLLVGPDWKRFDTLEQKQLVILFEHYTIANYAHEFRRFHGETFKVIDTKRYPDYQVVVTKLSQPSGKDHTFMYLMEPIQNQWKVVNIFVDGVSNIALLRSQYLYIVRKNGPAGLLRYLHHEIIKLEDSKR